MPGGGGPGETKGQIKIRQEKNKKAAYLHVHLNQIHLKQWSPTRRVPV